MHKLAGIQVLRGVAAFAVVVYHVCVLSVDYSQGIISSSWQILGKAGVDLFFVISGFVMVYTTDRRFDDLAEPGRFLVNRASRIIPPYWLLSLPVLAYYLYNPAGVNAKTGGVDIVASFLLLPGPLFPLVPVAWTLVYECFFYLVFLVLLVFLPRRHLGTALLAWAAGVLAMIAAQRTWPSAVGDPILLFSPYNLEFVAGALIGLQLRRRGGVSALASRALIITATAWFAATALYFEWVAHADIIPLLERVALFLPPSAMLVAGVASATPAPRRITRWWVWVGDRSYALYLTHILVFHLAYRVAVRLWGSEWAPAGAVAFALALVLASLVVAELFYRWIEGPSCEISKRALSGLLQSKRRAEPPPELEPTVTSSPRTVEGGAA